MQREVDRLVCQSLALNTKRSYNTGLSAFANFRSNFNIPETWPPKLDTVLHFIAHLSLKNLSINTARLYVSSISYNCKILNLNDVTNNFLVSKVLEGFRRSFKKSDARLPITPSILSKILATLPRVCINAYELKLFTSAYTLAFWGLFRIGELVVDSSNNSNAAHSVLLRSDVCLSEDNTKLSVHLRMSKTDQYGKGTSINIPRSQNTICAVSKMVDFLESRPQNDGPLFCHFNGKPLTKYQFSSMLNKTITLAGFGESGYKSHSFRIGAATALSMAGFSDERIKEFGRWKSSAFKSYIRPSRVNIPVELI